MMGVAGNLRIKGYPDAVLDCRLRKPPGLGWSLGVAQGADQEGGSEQAKAQPHAFGQFFMA
jgi:hypothetical protein